MRTKPDEEFHAIHEFSIAPYALQHTAEYLDAWDDMPVLWTREFATMAEMWARLTEIAEFGASVSDRYAGEPQSSHGATPFRIYYKITGVGHWFTITRRPPKFRRDGKPSSSSREQFISFANTSVRDLAFAVMNSSLFYWFYQLRTNCRDFNPSDFRRFPLPATLTDVCLEDLAAKIQARLDESSTFSFMSYKQTGRVEVETFRPRSAKDLVDQVDRILAKHYGFTDEELDFIINYDIKYRVGAEEDSDEE